MRIDLSRPLPGLLMALPLIAILLSVSPVPIAVPLTLSRAKEAAIDTTGTAAVICAPNIERQPGRAIVARLEENASDRLDSLGLIGEPRWHNRPEAAIGCEVMISCQPRSMARHLAVYD